MTFRTELMTHQTAAVNKLIGIRVGALYMEMGTGKTRTALEMVARRFNSEKIDRVLWLCPCSVRTSLISEIKRHCIDMTDSITVYGIESLSSSDRLYEELKRYVSDGTAMIIVDESNLVKNHKAIRTERITSIAMLCRYRLLLNGTPISKNEADLFAQWYMLDWRILGYKTYSSFAANHIEYDPVIPGRIRRALNTDYLVEKIAPYAFICSRSECFTLPRKIYKRIGIALSDEQRTHYDEVCEAMIGMMDDMRPETIYRMFSAAQSIVGGMRVDIGGKHIVSNRFFDDPKDDPRIARLSEILDEIGNEKVIVYAKYTREIDDILSVLPDSVGFYGKIDKRTRDANLDEFRKDKRILVANKMCAGYGLNLQFCRNVIYYSNDWDWATRAQSEDRVHRIGQDREVRVFDMEAIETIDTRILRCLSKKERMCDAVNAELSRCRDVKEARGTFRTWLKGVWSDGESIHG